MFSIGNERGKGLSYVERYSVWIPVSLFFCLFYFASSSGAKTEEMSDCIPSETVQVTIGGAVERPGIYEVKPGSTLASICKRAGLKKTADRKKLYLKKTILSSVAIEVPEKRKDGERGKNPKRKKCRVFGNCSS